METNLNDNTEKYAIHFLRRAKLVSKLATNLYGVTSYDDKKISRIFAEIFGELGENIFEEYNRIRNNWNKYKKDEKLLKEIITNMFNYTENLHKLVVTRFGKGLVRKL